MDVRTFRAPTLYEALALVRRDLGPDAAVLHTREVAKHRLLSWLPGPRLFEVLASNQVRVLSRLPVGASTDAPGSNPPPSPPSDTAISSPAARPAQSFALRGAAHAYAEDSGAALFDPFNRQLENLADCLSRTPAGNQRAGELSDDLFHLYAELIDAELGEEIARELVDRIRREATPTDCRDPERLHARVQAHIQAELRVCGPLTTAPGTRRIVALVGPTGVGKTTTIAKLAAHYRLREKRRVGLITVDTYRIAAVEQLRTYADIIDLPMHVVSTPREMRDAIAHLADMELVLLDTAGRSPRDEVKIQELKSFLQEARADEVHLVLSSGASASTLTRTAERFAAVGTTALVITKLDEASALGNLLPLLRQSRLPISYVTTGQSVPDDIEAADSLRLARAILRVDAPLRGGVA